MFGSVILRAVQPLTSSNLRMKEDDELNASFMIVRTWTATVADGASPNRRRQIRGTGSAEENLAKWVADDKTETNDTRTCSALLDTLLRSICDAKERGEGTWEFSR